jgi:hypothetical protein
MRCGGVLVEDHQERVNKSLKPVETCTYMSRSLRPVVTVADWINKVVLRTKVARVSFFLVDSVDRCLAHARTGSRPTLRG